MSPSRDSTIARLQGLRVSMVVHGVVHVADLLSPPETEALLKEVEALFTNPAPRDTFTFITTETPIPRDKVALYLNASESRVPLYRYTRTIRQKNPNTVSFANVTLPGVCPSRLAELINIYYARAHLPLPNHIVVHRYRDGSDHINEHHDKVADMARPTPDTNVFIGVFSLGCTRRFRILTKRLNAKGKYTFRKKHDYKLQHGDALFMDYDANLRYKHKLLTEKSCGVRYSVTTRTMATCCDPDTKIATTADGKTHTMQTG